MFQAYWYSLKKHLNSKSTWIIAAFAFFITLFFLGYLTFYNSSARRISFLNYSPSLDYNYNFVDKAPSYITVLRVTYGAAAPTAMLIAIFCGFKGAFMMRDEVEDSTFLLMISKPISRFRLIIAKFAALITLTSGFVLVLTNMLLIGITIGDARRQYVMDAGFYFSLLGYVFGGQLAVMVVFLGIGVFVSSIRGSGFTIGISTAIGLYVPISGIIEAVTMNNQTSYVGTPRQLFGIRGDDINRLEQRLLGNYIEEESGVEVRNKFMQFILQGPETIRELSGFTTDVFQQALEIVPANQLDNGDAISRALISKFVSSISDQNNIYLSKLDLFDPKYGYDFGFIENLFPWDSDQAVRQTYLRSRVSNYMRAQTNSDIGPISYTKFLTMNIHIAAFYTPIRQNLIEGKSASIFNQAIINGDPTTIVYVGMDKTNDNVMSLNNGDLLGDRIYDSLKRSTDLIRSTSALFGAVPGVSADVAKKIKEFGENLKPDDLFNYLMNSNVEFGNLDFLKEISKNRSLEDAIKLINANVPHLSQNVTEKHYFDYRALYGFYVSFGLIMMIAGLVVMIKSNYR